MMQSDEEMIQDEEASTSGMFDFFFFYCIFPLLFIFFFYFSDGNFAFFDPIENFRDESGSEDSDDNTEEIEETLDGQDDQEFIPLKEEAESDDPYPTTAKKREILEYWRSGQKRKRKSLEKMQNKYRKLNTLTTLYNWEKMLDHGMNIL